MAKGRKGGRWLRWNDLGEGEDRWQVVEVVVVPPHCCCGHNHQELTLAKAYLRIRAPVRHRTGIIITTLITIIVLGITALFEQT